MLRCPHCGTTQSSPGECQACHEAHVRYFCSNHNPGEWFDQPRCPRCGARFGEPVPSQPPAATRPPPQKSPQRPSQRRVSTARVEPPVVKKPKPWRGPWERRRRLRTREDHIDVPDERVPYDLRDEFELYPDPWEPRPPDLEIPHPGIMLGGCLRMALSALVFLFFLFVLFSLFVGSTFVTYWY
jgi:hypothetical protein